MSQGVNLLLPVLLVESTDKLAMEAFVAPPELADMVVRHQDDLNRILQRHGELKILTKEKTYLEIESSSVTIGREYRDRASPSLHARTLSVR